MKKRLLIMLLSFAAIFNSNAQTNLSYGDILIVGINAQIVSSTYGCNWSCSGTREIHVMPLVDLTNGTHFKITIAGFNSNASSSTASSNARTVSGILKWVNNTGSTISKGTVITFYKDNSTGNFTATTGACSNVSSGCSCGSVGSAMGVSTSVGKYFIYQGSGANDSTAYDFSASSSATATFNGRPIFLFYMQSTQSNAGFITSGSSGNFATYCPSDMTNYSLALGNSTQNGYYSGPRTGLTVSQLRDSILDPNKWVTHSYTPSSSAVVQVPTSSFSFGTPTITASTASLSAFTACSGSNSSNQSFTVSGSNLTGNISVSAPSGFEVSTSSGSGYGASVSLSPSSGSVSTTTIYARLTTSASGSPSGNISCTATNATTKNISVSGTVTSNVTPSVSLSITSGSSSICSGSSVTFTATPTNGGASPVYNFKVNGNSVQNSSTATYTSTSFANSDAVTCTMTANNTCQTTATANNGTTNMTVTTNVTPSVSLSITSGSSSICSGASVTFTATPTNGGSSPVYNFKVNGNSVQNSSTATYTSTSFANSDAVTCTMTANNTCQTTATANSGTTNMTVTTNVTP
ncbi:MAG: hypothetical protein HYZ42_14870, partial [Bacteroidetes bacterium]|nr:hypothetical protein [Bacteroidota bacterium]